MAVLEGLLVTSHSQLWLRVMQGAGVACASVYGAGSEYVDVGSLGAGPN